MDRRLRRPMRAAAAIALLALATVLATRAVAEPLRIGGTGAALGTMRVLGEAFHKAHPQAEVEVLPSLGSTGGIRALLAGAIEVGVTARPLTVEERAEGAHQMYAGRTPFAFAVSTSSAVTGLSSAELVEIYGGERTRWPDGTPVRLVLRTPAGSENALLYAISPQMKAAHLAAEKRPGLLTTATDQENAEALERIPGGLGVITLAQILTEKRSLRTLQIDGVAPVPVALRERRYHLSVPLFLAVRGKPSPLARDFLAFVRSEAGTGLLLRAGYLTPAPDEAR